MSVESAQDIALKQLRKLRPSLEYFDEELFPCGGPIKMSLIEVSGDSNCGKSTLLFSVMVRCVLPTYLGGKCGEVIFVDFGHKFDEQYFVKFATNILKTNDNMTSGEHHEVIKMCLKSIHILSCYSTEEFEGIAHIISNILWKAQNVAMLLIDDLDAFYWLDTYKTHMRMCNHYSRLRIKLKQLCSNHNICCAYSISTNYLNAKANLYEPWLAKVDYKLQLKLFSDGSRSLNSAAVYIDEYGFHFKTH